MRREVVVIVEPDLAEGSRQRFGLNRVSSRTSRFVRIAAEMSGFVRMNADGKADRTPRGRDRCRTRSLGLILGSEDDERTGDPCGLGTRHHGREVPAELVPRQVTVRIDHRTREPAGRLGSTATSDGNPPSGLAASTMPLDSMPINLAGLRFATMTIVRPTS